MGIYDKIKQKRTKEKKILIKNALKDATKIGCILYKKFGAKEVILYGSILDESKFTKRSDIDFAVKGLESNYFRAYGYCIRNCNFDIDIKPYEDMTEHFKNKITRYGKKLSCKTI